MPRNEESEPTASVPDLAAVPEGFCTHGCGRAVRDGLTKNGHKYTTCCKGCAMGFGHDFTCCAAVFGEGKCKNGCGRAVNPGLTRTGNPYDTCCRGCKSGTHDFTCGAITNQTNVCVELAIATGMCRIGCGREAAKSSDGRIFTTCCRGCASGYGHSKTCGNVTAREANNISEDGPKLAEELETPKAEPEDRPAKARAKAKPKSKPAAVDDPAKINDGEATEAKTKAKAKPKIKPAAADDSAKIDDGEATEAKAKAKAKTKAKATEK